MDPIEAARSVLPAWVSWGPVVIYPALALVLGIVLAMGGAAIGVIGLARLPEEAWAERARVAWPARLGSTVNLIIFPLVFGAAALLFAGPISRAGSFTLMVLAGLAATIGPVLARRWVDRRAGVSRLGVRRWLRSLAAVLIAYQPQLPVVIAGGIAAGPELGVRAAIAFVLFGGAMLWLGTGRGLLLARGLGIARDASPHVRAVCEGVSAKIGQPLRGVDVLDWAAANALAYPLLGRIAFTPRALEVLDDAELEAVAAHEIGHLREARATSWTRVGMVLLFAPLMLLVPFYTAFGVIGVVAPFLVVAIGAILFRRVARRMEERADAVAHDHANESGVYAVALEKLYRANLAPAVMPRGRKVHPDLYDRMLAAGVTPSYPRPAPPSKLKQNVITLVPIVVALGILGSVRIAALVAAEFGEGPALAAMAVTGGDPADLTALAVRRLEAHRVDEALVLSRAAVAAGLTESARESSSHAYVAAAAGRCDEAWAAATQTRERAQPGWDEEYVSAAFESAAGCQPGVVRHPRDF